MKRFLTKFLPIVGLGFLYSRYRQEKQQALKRFRANSQLLNHMEYAVQGEGIPILILHAGMAGYEFGMAIGNRLGLAQQKMIAVSRAGHRQTSFANGRTLPDQAQAIRQLLDQLNVEKTFVMGISGGGMSAIQFAHDHPDKCAGLILLSAHGPALRHLQPSRFWLDLMNLMIIADFPLWLMLKVAKNLLIRLNGNDPKEGNFDIFFDCIFPSSDWADGLVNDVEQLLGSGNLQLEAIQPPVLLIHGDKDVIVPYDVAQDSHRRLSHSQLLTIPNGTHLMMLTHSQTIGDAISTFMENGKATKNHNLTF
jgi:pimeloyl-ACP methyl ester carboxylesterase